MFAGRIPENAALLLGQCDPVFCQIAELQTDVWIFSIAASTVQIEPHLRLLDAEERTRAARFHRTQDRDSFVLAHIALRIVLGWYTHTEPASLRFTRGPRGKPALALDELCRDIRFNLSHSGEKAVIAVTTGLHVGVDVERVEQRRADMAVAERFFSRREVKVLQRLPESVRATGFFSCWTRKEAYIKARGDGLFIPLRDFDVSVGPDCKAALIGSRIEGDDVNRWRLRDLPVGADYAGALAVQCPNCALNAWSAV